MRSIIVIVLSALFFVGCQESMADKAEREAKEYTRKYCPTPVIRGTRTDSIVFDKTNLVYTYYISFFGELDNQELIDEHKAEIQNMLQSSLHEATGLKAYVESGFQFSYVCHSGKNPKQVLLKVSAK